MGGHVIDSFEGGRARRGGVEERETCYVGDAAKRDVGGGRRDGRGRFGGILIGVVVNAAYRDAMCRDAMCRDAMHCVSTLRVVRCFIIIPIFLRFP